MAKYDVAAYVWPAYTGDEKRARIFWEEGIGEWQTVKNSAPKDNGYFWNRKPLWGYLNEADPKVMEMHIKEATEHGVNVFIYDWYWYDRAPFLENCLNDGFLGARNCGDMRFYLMWANHDVNLTWDKRNAGAVDATIWKGAVDFAEFKKIGKRWIENYFTKENYYKLDNKPVVSIYDLNNFISGLGGTDGARMAMEWLREEAARAGLGGVHFQFVRWNGNSTNESGVDGGAKKTEAGLVEMLGFDSLTHYQFAHFTKMARDYREILEDAKAEWRRAADEYEIPYFPHVSVGWDNNPRFKHYKTNVTQNNTPENFEVALREAKAFADAAGVSLITVNSWNEWTETSYLMPDDLYGYGYLNAVKRVFKE